MRGKVLVLAGTTGVGKTAVALELAQMLDGEVVNADSVQVYQGLDIGSAKIPESERRGIPHHLLDLLPPSQSFNAGDWCDAAWEVTADIIKRNKVPIVVGGNGMYMRWFVDGKPDAPPVADDIRQRARSEVLACRLAVREAYPHVNKLEAEQREWAAGLELLTAAGGGGAVEALLPNDYYRLARALEIIYTSGQPRETFAVPGSTSIASTPGVLKQGISAPDVDFRCFFLHGPRMKMYRRVDRRCEEMVRDGMLLEAQAMLDAGLQPGSVPASTAIGYRQAMEYIQDCEGSREVLERRFMRFLSNFQAVTRKYTTRQITWFRKEPRYHYVDVAPTIDTPRDTAEQIAAVFRRSQADEAAQHTEGSTPLQVLSKAQEKEVRAYLPKQTLFQGTDAARKVDQVLTALLRR